VPRRPKSRFADSAPPLLFCGVSLLVHCFLAIAGRGLSGEEGGRETSDPAAGIDVIIAADSPLPTVARRRVPHAAAPERESPTARLNPSIRRPPPASTPVASIPVLRVRLAEKLRPVAQPPTHREQGELPVRPEGASPGLTAAMAPETGAAAVRETNAASAGMERQAPAAVAAPSARVVETAGVPFGTDAGAASRGIGPSARVAYVLDISRSMRDEGKIGVARRALFRAAESLPGDAKLTFIVFSDKAVVCSTDFGPASDAFRKPLEDRLTALDPYGETNLSGALDAALALPGVTDVFLLSDGQPTVGITDYDELRAHLKQVDAGRARLSTFALGAGEQFEGVELLRNIAADNGGAYRYVDVRGR
jgi:Mg-chelatase subunit ChlD